MPPGVNGFVTVGGAANGIAINAGSNAVVSLRGLIVECSESNSGGAGILINSVANMSVEDCTVRNFQSGLRHLPNHPEAKLYAYNTTVRGCLYGINVTALNPFTNRATLNGCQLEQNSHGLFAGNSGGTVDVTLTGCTIAGCAIAAVEGDGANVTVRVSRSSITNNAAGVSAINGSQVLSRGNNTLENNASGNTFPGAYSAK